MPTISMKSLLFCFTYKKNHECQLFLWSFSYSVSLIKKIMSANYSYEVFPVLFHLLEKSWVPTIPIFHDGMRIQKMSNNYYKQWVIDELPWQKLYQWKLWVPIVLKVFLKTCKLLWILHSSPKNDYGYLKWLLISISYIS